MANTKRSLTFYGDITKLLEKYGVVKEDTLGKRLGLMEIMSILMTQDQLDEAVRQFEYHLTCKAEIERYGEEDFRKER